MLDISLAIRGLPLLTIPRITSGACMVDYLHDGVHVARVAEVLQTRVAGSVDRNQF
jgi:hypothetical protein